MSLPPTLRYLDPLRERGNHKIRADERAILLTVNQKVASKPSLNDVIDFLFEGTRSIIPFDRIGLALSKTTAIASSRTTREPTTNRFSSREATPAIFAVARSSP